MSDIHTFKLSPKFIETVLANNFGIPNTNYTNTTIYVGLGIEFNEDTFTFTKEPVSKWYTINQKPCIFNLMNKYVLNMYKDFIYQKIGVFVLPKRKLKIFKVYIKKRINRLSLKYFASR